jgi:hypothetical protein
MKIENELREHTVYGEKKSAGIKLKTTISK